MSAVGYLYDTERTVKDDKDRSMIDHLADTAANRVLACRTQGIPADRAGCLDGTLALAAENTARHSERQRIAADMAVDLAARTGRPWQVTARTGDMIGWLDIHPPRDRMSDRWEWADSDRDALAAALGYRPRRIETPRHMIRPDEIAEYAERVSGAEVAA